jgi:L-seryl-tRNA(Ser) seleniumtransferase
MSIFERWGVSPIINLCGSVTRLGGAPLRDEALEAFVAAASHSVSLEELQAAASRIIARITGAEAGLVTTGAAGGLMLGAAAILAGMDLRRIDRLPCTDGFPNEFVISRDQRNGYDHAVRATGARLVEVGMPEMIAGAGVRQTEVWDYETAFGPNTAAVLYVLSPRSNPPLQEVVKTAHAHGLPILVDAAGELPPRSNLQDIIATGADLVVFSGGKAIRGPQATGILCGRRRLIQSAALQMLDLDDHWDLWSPPPDFIDRSQLPGLPRHGIGRALKVSKEQIAALLVALEAFARGDDDAQVPLKRRLLQKLADALSSRCTAILQDAADGQCLPLLELHVGPAAWNICRELRRGNPPIYVGHAKLSNGILTIHPMHLDEATLPTVISRLLAAVTHPIPA